MSTARSASATRCLLGLCACLWALLAHAAEPPGTRFEAPRVVAFGDVHGAYSGLVELLTQAEVISDDLEWQGGATHLVSLGDLLDRGPDSRLVMDLLRRLQGEARAAGGRVHVVLGNHELMNMTGDLRYVAPGEFAAFAEPGSSGDAGRPAGFVELAAAFTPDGTYGAWLMAQPTVVIVNDSVFVHGGLSPLAGQYSPEELNATVRARLEELLTLRAELEAGAILAPHREVTEAALELRQSLADAAIAEPWRAAVARFIELAEDPLMATEGPLWYRGNATCHALLETPLLTRVLEHWQVRRVVVGHTPTPDYRVRSRLGGRVLLADTGMNTDYYGGQPAAVIIDDQGPRVIYAGRPGTTPPDEDPGTPLHPLSEPELLTALESSDITTRPDLDSPHGQAVELHGAFAGAPVQAWFRPLGRRQIEAELAAFRLDRLLELNLAAPVVRRTLDGVDGTVTALWAGSITEAERAERGLMPLNTCSGSDSAFLLLYAFDALIQNQARTTTNMHYDRRTWRLASTGHQASFGRGRQLPAYLAASPQQLPAAVAQALRRLDEDLLEAALGDDLNRAQRRALLSRRDVMFRTWTIGD
ncbi:MAG: metallophosphoesterase [Pseudomonadales bacterium]